MKTLRSKLICGAALVVGTLSAQAQVKDVVVDTKGNVPYAIDGRGVIARNATGLCWRTVYWTPQLAAETKVVNGQFPAGCDCDKDLMPKDKCTPPPPPPPAAAPAPKPAPAPAPAPAPKPAAQKFTLSTDTLFDFDKAVLRPEGQQALDKLIADIKGVQLEVIIAVGHADRIGADKYNQKLSERRAMAVKEYLVGKGIEQNRVYVEGKGEKQPVTGGKCDGMKPENRKNKKLIECLQPDRRVEIEVIGTK